jgi:two-component system phosphate regulon sensor histidine kinase PhoR
MTVFKKSLLCLCATVFFLCVLLSAAALFFMDSRYYAVTQERLRETARALYAAQGIADRAADGEDVFSPPFPPSPAEPYRITLIDTRGEVVRDTAAKKKPVNHLDRAEVKAALEGNEAGARRFSLSTGARSVYAAVPITGPDGSLKGVFRVSLEVPPFWKRISPQAAPFLAFAFVSACAACAVLCVFAKSLSASLGRLLRLTGAAGGEKSGDELYLLEKTIRAAFDGFNGRIERAEEKAALLETILDGMSEAVFVADNDLNLILANPNAKNLFGLADSDAQNISLLRATRSTELENAAKTALETALPFRAELKLDAERRFRVFSAPLADSRGIMLVLRDVTRVFKLEQTRKDFVANVSHELRTPIQLLKGFSETLLDSPLDDREETRRFVEIINKNTAAMENLVNDLLILASLENSTNRDFPTHRQEIAVLFEEAVFSVTPEAREKRIRIFTDCPENLAAKLHARFVVRALVNLLDNAIKYSPADSDVRMCAERDGGGLVLRVRDEGKGIPAAHFERIFERFYRIDRSRNRDGAGTGLGLSIVRRIALLHGGKVEVESVVGEGSTFTIRIPQD